MRISNLSFHIEWESKTVSVFIIFFFNSSSLFKKFFPHTKILQIATPLFVEAILDNFYFIFPVKFNASACNNFVSS